MKQLTLSFVVAVLLCMHCTDSPAQINRTREHISDDPDDRAEYDFIRLRDPKTHEIPPNIAQKEFEFASKLPKHFPSNSRLTAQSAFDWQFVGPMNQSGRIQAIGLDVSNTANILAGTASGGVWRSIDFGASWVKVTLPNEQQTVSSIVQDTRIGKQNIWYYSTSELLSTTGRRETSNIRTHSGGNGIYRSTDDGASWHPIASTVTTSSHTAEINFAGVWNLALDHKNASQNIIYAACFGGIMRSSDGGASWQNVLGGDSAKCFNSEIVIGSNGTLYAAIGSAYDGTATPHQGIWRSDDGIHWINISGSTLPKLVRRWRLALSASNDNILYCLSETPGDWTAADQIFVTDHNLSRYSYNSGDGSGTGGTWETQNIPFDNDPQQYNNSLGGYCLAIAVHPDDPDQVLIGGNSLYYSKDGFQNDMIKLGGYADDPQNPPPNPLHPDIHTIVFPPKDPSRLFVGNDGGISVTSDYSFGPNDWTELNNGLGSAQVYHSSFDHTTTSDLILSGLQDNNTYATLTSDPADPWFPVDGGDGMTAAVCNGGEMFFTSWQGANIDCLTYDGTSIIYHGRLPVPTAASYSTFFTNYILEPNQTNQLYLAMTDELWRFNDLSDLANQFDPLTSDWFQITAVYNTLRAANAFISSFGFATNVRDRLFFGTNTGKVYAVDNAGSVSPILRNISGSEFPVNGFVSGVEVDPEDANNIIAVFSNYHVQSLFHTIDGGKNWISIGGNLEELPDGAGAGPSVRCAKIFHTASGTIYYVGTTVGLYSTTKLDGAQTIWVQEAPTTIGSLIVEAIDSRQIDQRILVSTQGGGVFRNMSSSTGKVQGKASESLQFEQNYPNPFSDESSIRFILDKRSDVIIEMYNALGKKITTVIHSLFDAGSHTVRLSGKDLPSGNYFVRITAGDAVSTKMITVVR